LDSIRGSVASLDDRKGADHWFSAAGGLTEASGKTVRFTHATCVRGKGDWLVLHGCYAKNDRGYLSFKVEKTISCLPETQAEVLAWLGDEAAWPDLGRGKAFGICTALGEMRTPAKEVFQDEDLVLELSARSLVKPAELATLVRIWRERAEFAAAQNVLYDAGFVQKEVASILREFQPAEAQRVLKEDPFLFEERIEGIGFKRADQVARKVGFDERHPTRIVAGIRHAVNVELENGHTWLEESQAVSHAVGELQVYERDFILERLREGAAAGKLARIGLHDGTTAVASSWMLQSETMFIERVCNADPNPHFPEPLDEEQVGRIEPRALPAQRMAISTASRLKNLVVTGAAGTGKSFIAAAVARMYLRRGKKVMIAAPTGKAAKRMFQVLREQGIDETEPKTIHKYLEYNGREWGKNSTNKLDVDVAIIDEASMVDVAVMRRLIEALKPEAALILFGDHNQLPPIGAGAILRDLCAGGGCEVIRLDQVVRQAGRLRMNSLEVLAGRVKPTEPPNEGFTPWVIDDRHATPGDAFKAILRWYDSFLDALGASQETIQRVQVITPQKEGLLGLTDLNSSLQLLVQRRVLGDDLEDARGKTEIRGGDKVLQTKNDYDPRILLMNGDMGTVSRLDRGQLHVAFPFRDQPVEIPWEKKRNLMLAYAITAHRCVAPDTLVETEAGIMPISAMSGTGVVATTEGPRPYRGVIHNEARPMLRITTKHGYSIDVTPEHGMMAWNGMDRYEKVEAQALERGTFLRLRLGPTCDRKDLVRLHASAKQDVRAKIHRTPTVVDEAVGEFLGLMVGDGTVFSDGFRLAKRHVDVVDRFSKLVADLFGYQVRRVTLDGCEGAEVHSVQLAEWLLAIPGVGPNDKDVPPQILSSPIAIQAAFLRGLFEDGTVNLKSDLLDHVEFGSKFERVARKVQIMLLRFGVISARRHRTGLGPNKDCGFHLVYIYGKNAHRFRDATNGGFISKFKRDRLSTKTGLETRYLIPVDKTRFKHSSSTGSNAKSRGCISRHVAESLGGFEEDLRFHHDRIVKIEKIHGESMCVTVPDVGRFLQNGFDGSNSQGSEWDHVIVVAHSSLKAPLKTRNLFYTAVTRAAKSVVVVGDKRGIEEFAANVKDERRRTLLGAHLAKLRGDA